MLLSDHSIAVLAVEDELITPFHTEQLQPCSYDVTLGNKILRMVPVTDKNELIDKGDPRIFAFDKTMRNIEYREHYISDTYTLAPDEFILATTKEVVHIPDEFAARFEGKSSLGRMGLTTHITAGFIDAGFNGEITLEMKNETMFPIVIKPGMKIGQLCFFMLDKPAQRPYGSEGLGSHYQGQSGPTAATN